MPRRVQAALWQNGLLQFYPVYMGDLLGLAGASDWNVGNVRNVAVAANEVAHKKRGRQNAVGDDKAVGKGNKKHGTHAKHAAV